MKQCAPLATLQMTQNWEEWYIRQRNCPTIQKKAGQGGEMVFEESHGVHQKCHTTKRFFYLTTKGKCLILLLKRTNLMLQAGYNCLENSFTRLGVVVDTKLNMS